MRHHPRVRRLVAVLALTVLTGCGGGTSPETSHLTPQSSPKATPSPAETPRAPVGPYQVRVTTKPQGIEVVATGPDVKPYCGGPTATPEFHSLVDGSVVLPPPQPFPQLCSEDSGGSTWTFPVPKLPGAYRISVLIQTYHGNTDVDARTRITVHADGSFELAPE